MRIAEFIEHSLKHSVKCSYTQLLMIEFYIVAISTVI